MSTTSDLHFRLAIPEDAERIRQLVENSFRTQDTRPDWTDNLGLSATFRMSIDEIAPKISGADSDILMATDADDTLFASIIVYKRDPEMARLAMLAVDPARQCGGVGRQILAYAEDYSRRTWGIKKLGLNALCNREKLIQWYLRRGYQKTGEVTPFPRELARGLDLPEDLGFVEMEKDAIPHTAE